MATAVTMPQLGESIVEGTVARWLKAAGDPVERDEPLLDISTDKIDTEVPSPAAGTLLQIVADEGQTVSVGTVLAYIGAEGESLEDDGGPAPSGKRAATPAPSVPDGGEGRAPTKRERPSGRAFISPVVARIADEHDVDLDQVDGTGLHGRITKKDMLAYVARRDEDVARRPSPADRRPPGAPAAQETVAISAVAISGDESLQPLSTMRRAIAEHMVRSVRTSPHVVAIHEADMTAVVRHRERHRRAYAELGISLTFTPYFVAAVARALRAVPRANSRYTDQGIVLNRRIHVGVAVAVENGLLVPVLRDADERNLQGLARAVNDLAERARSGRLSQEELSGGTFTLTNHGVGGSLLATPIINQPQAGILGVGKIGKRPVVRGGSGLLPSADDAIVIRPMCYLSFSFDHRILDGADGDRFVSHVVAALEEWEE